MPDVYVVTHNGVLRWLKTEELATMLYGDKWPSLVRDVPDSFFANYKMGEPLDIPTTFDPNMEKNANSTIDIDRELLNN